MTTQKPRDLIGPFQVKDSFPSGPSLSPLRGLRGGLSANLSSFLSELIYFQAPSLIYNNIGKKVMNSAALFLYNPADKGKITVFLRLIQSEPDYEIFAGIESYILYIDFHLTTFGLIQQCNNLD